MIRKRKSKKIQTESCSTATSFAVNFTWNHPAKNPSHCGKNPECNRLSYNTAYTCWCTFHSILFARFGLDITNILALQQMLHRMSLEIIVTQLINKIIAFMEPGIRQQTKKKTATGPHPEPAESSPHLHTQFSKTLFLSTPTSPILCLLFRFCDQNILHTSSPC
jgi:hypothetical protein